jgi:predicted HTH transcriptional regulator
LLADPFFLAGYIEQAGTGTLDMIARSREAGLKTPAFRQDGGSFVQTLWRPAPLPSSAPAPAAGSRPKGETTPQAATQDNLMTDEVLPQLAEALGLPTPQATPQAATQVAKLLEAAGEVQTRELLQRAAGMADREHFRKTYLEPLLTAGWIERTLPDKPTSPHQRYRLTEKGQAWLALAPRKKGKSS